MKYSKRLALLIICAYLLSGTAGCDRHIGLGLGVNQMIAGADSSHYASVNIEQKELPPMKLLSITYETKSTDDIGMLLNAGYIDLCTFINLHRLPCGRVMAFYYTYEAPFVLDAAIEVDSLPPVLSSNIKSRVLEGGEALIVHYRGPYENASFAYHALEKWLKDHGKEAKGLPFEVYLNDPVTIRNRYQLLTDIYQFIK